MNIEFLSQWIYINIYEINILKLFVRVQYSSKSLSKLS